MKIHRDAASASWRCPLASQPGLVPCSTGHWAKFYRESGDALISEKVGQAGGFLEPGIQWNVAMHISNVSVRSFQYKAAICTRTANSTPSFQWGQKNAKFQMEENSHMTLAHSSRPFFTFTLLWGTVELGFKWGQIRIRGWTHLERLTFQSQLSSVLGKSTGCLYLFSHLIFTTTLWELLFPFY